MIEQPTEGKEVHASPLHAALLTDLAKVVQEFGKQHPSLDVVEGIVTLGSVAGAFISQAPDQAERDRARQSVIACMDAAITDFGFLFAKDSASGAGRA